MIRVLVFMLVCLMLTAQALAGTVELRRSARVSADMPVRLGDIARLDGAATALADVVIVRDPSVRTTGGRSWFEIEIEAVRKAIESSGSTSPGRVALRGGRCAVRVLEPAGESDASAGASASEPQIIDEGPTVRAQIRRRLARLFGVDPSELRLDFDDRDSALLSMNTLGRTVEIRSLGASDRMPLGVTVYEGDRVAASGTVRVGVLIRRSVLVASEGLRRGATVRADELVREERWVSPGVRPATMDQATGSVARSRLSPGDMIERTDIEPPLVVRRGDVVWVHCVSGSIVLREKARARAQGREGDVIEFESMDSSNRKFSARVDGPGRAVTVSRSEASIGRSRR